MEGENHGIFLLYYYNNNNTAASANFTLCSVFRACTLLPSSAQVDAVTKHISRGEVFVGVKKLLGLLDTMRVMKGVDSQKRVGAFCNLLEDEGIFTPSM